LLCLGLLVEGQAFADKLVLFAEGADSTAVDLVRASAARAGHSLEEAGASLDDTVLLLGCDPESDECLDQVAETLTVDGLVIVKSDGSTTSVRLRHGGSSENAALEGDSDAWAASVDAVFGVESAVEATTQDDPQDTGETVGETVGEETGGTAEAGIGEETTADPVTGDGRVERGALSQVRARTWYTLGGGVALLGAGAVFYGLAGSKQSAVDSHPTDTSEDFDRLVALEKKGERYTLWGNTLSLVGAGALVVGGVFLALDLRSDGDDDDDEGGVSAVLLPDHVGLTYSCSFDF
jgi:hypothetical protein